LSRKGFKEIYKIAGPFVDKVKKKWAKLLIERVGKIGGYKKSEKPTEKKILKLLNSKRNKWWSIMEICLKLRILPSTAREGIRNLEKKKLVKKKKVGKSTLWKISGGVPQTLPGLTAE
jgi:predicted HTH transcriptional regulator